MELRLTVPAAACLLAWLILLSWGREPSAAGYCLTGVPGLTTWLSTGELGQLSVSPARVFAETALMIGAMMPPLMMEPLRHVRERVFASRRLRAMSLFAVGYLAIWVVAGLASQGVASVARWGLVNPLSRAALAGPVALTWQMSPAKQWFLNLCHRWPSLPAFGMAADLGALRFGLLNGVACVGACWTLMLLALMIERGHLLAMFIVALFVFGERLEPAAPLSWGWHGPARAMRAIAVRLHSFIEPVSVPGTRPRRRCSGLRNETEHSGLRRCQSARRGRPARDVLLD